MNIAEFRIAKEYRTDQRGPVRWVFSHAIRQWPLLLMALFGAVGNAALAAVLPILMGEAFNLVLSGSPDLTRLSQIAITLAISQLIRGIIQFSRNFGFEWIAQRVERDVRDELYINLLGKSMTFHNLQSVGDTMSRATNDVREVNYLFSPGMAQVLGSLNFLIMPLIFAPRYHPTLILTPLIFVILYYFALRNYLGQLRPVTDRVRATFGQLNTRLSEALDGIETVKGSAQEDAEVARFSANAASYRSSVVRQGDVEARFIPLLLLTLALGFGLLHALILFRQGILDVGQVVAYFGLLLMLDFPTFASMWAYSRISLGLAGARRILDLMHRETYLDENVSGHQAQMCGEVEFEDVCFAYPQQNSAETDACDDGILQHISFRVKPGQTVAIVGQTGTGKTTLVRLINRIYDSTSGTVRVDGLDVRNWNLAVLRQQISIIEQDVFLFSRTIAENIAFGKPDATQEQIEAAAHAAQAHEFITSFSEGYQTAVGERGVTLSGGQRQRIALARAFLTDPRILILDDSTSAIDSATEDKIQRAIYTAARGRTTFIITHRLSQIRWADLILVLRRGQLVATGSHDELMKTSAAYRRIFSE